MLQYVPPFWDEKAEPGYPLGTDNLGRDILSRLIYGARVALFVAVTAAAAAGLLGTVFGLLAGYVGGWVDTVISRLVDIWMAFPAVVNQAPWLMILPILCVIAIMLALNARATS